MFNHEVLVRNSQLETVTFCYLDMELHAMCGGWGEEV
jgi:hypothetical protein